MSNYASLKATINANIKTNGNQEVTGNILNSVLNAMVNTLGAGYQYAGVATPSSNPGTPDTNVFYIAATAGTYTNMGGLVVSDGEVAILKYNGTWTKDVTGVATAERVSQLQQAVSDINMLSERGLDGDDALSFVDENGNCILQAKDGHIKTKEFDSRNAAKKDEITDFVKQDGSNGRGTLFVVDENGESIVQFKDGHIKTKEFNSEEIITTDDVDDNREALAIVDENGDSIVRFMGGHIKTKNFDSSNIVSEVSFASIGIDELSVDGSSTKADGQIVLSPGVANRAFLPDGFECAHWEMSAKFVCTGGVSFVMGKDSNTFGARLEIKTENGNGVYNFYNNGGQYSEVYSGTIDFTLFVGEEYTLRLFFNVTTTKILGFEIFGQFNEYFTHTFDNVTCNGYGSPFFYSDNTCTVKEFSLSNQNYYDIKNAKAAVWGHSYVEGDSLGSNRDKTFTNLLANAIGADKVFNFGLGGDNWIGVYNKMGNEMGIVSNIQYGLVCCGANDSNLSLTDTKSRITNIVALLQNNNIVPIIFTIAPIDRNRNGDWYNQMFVDANAWIRQNFLYVDMEQVFLDVDATGNWDASNVKTSLYLSDLIHPNVDGHAAIFRRIQMDCPFLF